MFLRVVIHPSLEPPDITITLQVGLVSTVIEFVE